MKQTTPCDSNSNNRAWLLSYLHVCAPLGNLLDILVLHKNIVLSWNILKTLKLFLIIKKLEPKKKLPVEKKKKKKKRFSDDKKKFDGNPPKSKKVVFS